MKSEFNDILLQIQNPFYLMLPFTLVAVLCFLFLSNRKFIYYTFFLFILIQVGLVSTYKILTNNYDSRDTSSMAGLAVIDNEFVGGYFSKGKIMSLFSLEYFSDKNIYISNSFPIDSNDFKYVNIKRFSINEQYNNILTDSEYYALKDSLIKSGGYYFEEKFSNYEKSNSIYFMSYKNFRIILSSFSLEGVRYD